MPAHSLNKTARIAGFLYLLVAFTGVFELMYVPRKLFVPDDPSATASNILAHQSLIEAHIAVGVISELLFISVVLLLYRLLKGVNREVAAVMVILILIDAPLAFLGVGNEAATLTYLRNPRLLAAFDKPQFDALATLLINFDAQSVLVSEVFWGLWLLPLGFLVYRSGFLPRFLGVWLYVNGLTYLVLSTLRLLTPGNSGTALTIATPFIFGEIALTFWLLFKGVKAETSELHAVQSRQDSLGHGLPA